MESYKAKTGKELDKTTQYAGFACSIALIVTAVFIRSIFTALVGIVIFAAVLMCKSVVVTDEGIITAYDLPLYNKMEVWGWDEIIEIYREPSPDNPDKVGLHFTKESMIARRLIFDKNDSEKVIEMALRNNDKIALSDE